MKGGCWGSVGQRTVVWSPQWPSEEGSNTEKQYNFYCCAALYRDRTAEYKRVQLLGQNVSTAEMCTGMGYCCPGNSPFALIGWSAPLEWENPSTFMWLFAVMEIIGVFDFMQRRRRLQLPAAACSPADLKQPMTFSASRQPAAAVCRRRRRCMKSNTPNDKCPVLFLSLYEKESDRGGGGGLEKYPPPNACACPYCSKGNVEV